MILLYLMDRRRNLLEMTIAIICGDVQKKAVSCIFRRNMILMTSMKNKWCIWFKPTKAPVCKSLSIKTCIPVLFIAEKS